MAPCSAIGFKYMCPEDMNRVRNGVFPGVQGTRSKVCCPGSTGSPIEIGALSNWPVCPPNTSPEDIQTNSKCCNRHTTDGERSRGIELSLPPKDCQSGNSLFIPEPVPLNGDLYQYEKKLKQVTYSPFLPPVL